ncbi:MAG TPA: YIP1 family protein [Gaiellaceae bacterium]|nr:YIP1 family protein [Gaiellaceae bacterium]
MTVGANAAETHALERLWWKRALAVLISPGPVFAALREDSDRDAAALQEPVLALILLGGVATVLDTTVTGHMLDDPAVDGLLVAVWAFIGGGFYGTALYWLGGGILAIAGDLLGSTGRYRRSRHVLALSLAPLALSLVTVWPLRIAVLGSSVFRSGGGDSGTAGAVFAAISLAFAAWALVLLVIGVRAVNGWSWVRSLAACGLAAAIPAVLVALLRL